MSRSELERIGIPSGHLGGTRPTVGRYQRWPKVPGLQGPIAVDEGHHLPKVLAFADRSYYIGLESVWDGSPDGRRFGFVRVEDEGNTRLQLMTNWVSAWRQP